MKLAVNYSEAAAGLLAAGAVQFDLYKTTEWPEMIAAAQRQRPAYIHLPYLAGRDDLGRIPWERVEAAFQTSDTPFFNMHIAPRAADFGAAMTDESLALVERYRAAMRRDITALGARVGRERVILENANYDPNYDIPIAAIRAEMICAMVAENDAGFLLDLGHARMSAVYLGLDEMAYIEQLPLGALKELHIAGTEFVAEEGRLVDHYPMSEADWRLAEWAFERIRAGAWPTPWVVALEYGGTGPHFAARSDPAVLARDLPRLAGMMGS